MIRQLLSCREIVELTTDYFEGAMPAETRFPFERHIAICPPCRGFLGQMRETLRVTGELSEVSLSPRMRDALVEAFRDWSARG